MLTRRNTKQCHDRRDERDRSRHGHRPGYTLEDGSGCLTIGVHLIYTDATGTQHGLLYDLNNNTFQNIDDPFGVGTTTINGINDLNQLVGFYVNGDDNTIGLLADPVPEPASLSLLAAGLFGIGGFARRRKAR